MIGDAAMPANDPKQTSDWQPEMRVISLGTAWNCQFGAPVGGVRGDADTNCNKRELPRTKPFICFNYGAFWSTSAVVSM